MIVVGQVLSRPEEVAPLVPEVLRLPGPEQVVPFVHVRVAQGLPGPEQVAASLGHVTIAPLSGPFFKFKNVQI